MAVYIVEDYEQYEMFEMKVEQLSLSTFFSHVKWEWYINYENIL